MMMGCSDEPPCYVRPLDSPSAANSNPADWDAVTIRDVFWRDRVSTTRLFIHHNVPGDHRDIAGNYRRQLQLCGDALLRRWPFLQPPVGDNSYYFYLQNDLSFGGLVSGGRLYVDYASFEGRFDPERCSNAMLIHELAHYLLVGGLATRLYEQRPLSLALEEGMAAYTEPLAVDYVPFMATTTLDYGVLLRAAETYLGCIDRSRPDLCAVDLSDDDLSACCNSLEVHNRTDVIFPTSRIRIEALVIPPAPNDFFLSNLVDYSHIFRRDDPCDMNLQSEAFRNLGVGAICVDPGFADGQNQGAVYFIAATAPMQTRLQCEDGYYESRVGYAFPTFFAPTLIQQRRYELMPSGTEFITNASYASATCFIRSVEQDYGTVAVDGIMQWFFQERNRHESRELNVVAEMGEVITRSSGVSVTESALAARMERYRLTPSIFTQQRTKALCEE